MQAIRILKLLLVTPILLALGLAHAAELKVGDTPPFPAMQSIDGKAINADSLRGKLVVVSYFATTCPFCMNEAPKLQKLYRENKDRLIVIGVNVQKNDPQQLALARQWIQKYKLTFPVTLDFAAAEAAFGKLNGLPVNQIFDRSGKVIRIDIGEIFDEDFDDIARMAR